MNHAQETRAMGWLRDLPDVRDFRIDQAEPPQRAQAAGHRQSVRELLAEVGALDTPVAALPQVVDLRAWMSPIEDQGSIGSCTAQAGAGLIEYFERRAFGRHINASRLFLYKATRNLLQWTGDTGAYLRTTMGAMAIFGVPPEQYWKYAIADFDKEPTAFCYAFGQSYQSLQYYRLDPVGTDPAVLLNRIKTNLATGLPSMFGFTVYSSINQAGTTGAIPFPTGGESILGGHAVVAAGFDDNKVIRNNNAAAPTKGALLVRNSWGTGWGQAGYGWLPYAYVLGGAAVDWWSLVKHEWIETGQFGVTTTLAGMPTVQDRAEMV